MIFGELSEFLPWIIRIIVVLLILRLVRNMFAPSPRPRPRQSQPPPRSGPTAVERSGGKLVRDPQCGTYIPMSSSVHLVSGSETLYFCSTECRDAYRQAKSA
jgi:YHS domain-containing protein